MGGLIIAINLGLIVYYIAITLSISFAPKAGAVSEKLSGVKSWLSSSLTPKLSGALSLTKRLRMRTRQQASQRPDSELHRVDSEGI